MSSLRNRKIGVADALEMRLTATGETATILLSHGATVYSLCLGADAQEVLEMDYEDEIASNPKFRGRILFPFNDRIPQAKYSFEGKEYHLPVNCPEDGSAIHGLVYDRSFNVLSQESSPDRVRVVVGDRWAENTWAGYPFSLDFQIAYTLEPNVFKIEFRMENHSKQAAPIALGWHPYFRLDSDVGVGQHLLELPANAYVAVDESLLPTGETPSCHQTALDFSHPTLIQDLELDVALIPSKSAVLRLDQRTLVLEQDPSFFKYVQLYTPETRSSIAIEPVSGATDALNRPELGRVDLAPGAIQESWCQVRVQ